MIDVMVREVLYLIQLEVPRIFYLTVSNVSIVRRRAAEEYSNEEGYIYCMQRATQITTAALGCAANLEFIEIPLCWTTLHMIRSLSHYCKDCFGRIRCRDMDV